MTIKDVTIDDFSQALGEAYEIDLGETRIALTLEEVEGLPKSVREAGSFRLLFRGPVAPLLPQAIYRFERAGEAHDIFIVPIAQDREGTTYEAIYT